MENRNPARGLFAILLVSASAPALKRWTSIYLKIKKIEE